MLFIEQVSRVIKQVLARRQNPADRISQIVCRNFQQQDWIETILVMRGCRFHS
jgi:hypothetical protein